MSSEAGRVHASSSPVGSTARGVVDPLVTKLTSAQDQPMYPLNLPRK
jgi:hypothetical protein